MGFLIKGTIAYKPGARRYLFKIDAFDTSECMSMYITSGDYEAITLMAVPNPTEDVDFDIPWERAVEIKLTKLTVQNETYKNDKGKKVHRPVNSDFFCRMASLIRYAKTNCRLEFEEGYTGLTLASGDFDMSTKHTYILPYPTDSSREFCRITLDYGNIVELHLATDDFDMHLVEDYGVGERVFYRPKNGWSSGFRLNSEYLGIDIPEQKVEVCQHADGMYHSLEEVMRAHPEKELSYIRGKNYQIVTDETLEEVCTYLSNNGKYVFYDTETTGLNITFLSRTGQADVCVGVILSIRLGESFFFPFQMKTIKNLCGGDHFYVMEHWLRPLLERRPLVPHNAAFDWKVGYIYGINCNIVHDTMAMIAVTFGNEIKDYKLGLKENTRTLLGRDALELADLIIDNSWGENDIKFWDLPPELVRFYACADTDNVNDIFEYFMKNDILGKYTAHKIYEIEVAFALAVGYQEFYGHHMDVNNLSSLREELRVKQTDLMKQMEVLAGHPFNPNSPPQLRKVMYEELGIPEQISRKTGNVTTDKETLKHLAELTDIDDNIKYPFCKLLLDYRAYEGVRKIIDKSPEHMTSDGYIFSSVMQYGTTTGRVSINSPNYQSYNDPVKKNVVPRPGFYMTDTDYSSVEYRVLASMVGNQRIMTNFVDTEFDYHTYQAAHMYGIPYSAVTKKLRKEAKGINFGIPYGMGNESLGLRIYGEATDTNTRKAKALRAAYEKGQEDIRDWFERNRDKGVREGYTETFFGRRRYYRRSDFSEKAIRRQAGNQIIQGTAADIYKTAVGRVFRRICREGWLGKVLLVAFIHDELLCEVSNDINPGVWLRVLREEFEVKVHNDDGTPWCPLYMGFGYGMSWYEAKSVELPIKLQWELVDKYGTEGFADWDGDGRKFCDRIPDMLRDFDVRNIRNQLLDPENQGKEIKSALNTSLLDCIKEDSKVYSDCISEYIQESGDYAWIASEGLSMEDYLTQVEDTICQYLDKHVHIQCLYKIDGKPVDSFKSLGTTQGCLDQFCILHGVDRSKVNLLDIEEYDSSKSTSNISVEGDDVDDKELEQRLRELQQARLKNFGMYLDTGVGNVVLLQIPSQYMAFIQQQCTEDSEKGYHVYIQDKDGKLYVTRKYLPSSSINVVQQMYIQYFKAVS